MKKMLSKIGKIFTGSTIANYIFGAVCLTAGFYIAMKSVALVVGVSLSAIMKLVDFIRSKKGLAPIFN